jgi:hypothetical protein
MPRRCANHKGVGVARRWQAFRDRSLGTGAPELEPRSSVKLAEATENGLIALSAAAPSFGTTEGSGRSIGGSGRRRGDHHAFAAPSLENRDGA